MKKILFILCLSFNSYSFELILEPSLGVQYLGDIIDNNYTENLTESDEGYIRPPAESYVSLLGIDLGVKKEKFTLGFRKEVNGPDFISDSVWGLLSVNKNKIGRGIDTKKIFFRYDLQPKSSVEFLYIMEVDLKDGGSSAGYESGLGFGYRYKFHQKFNFNVNYSKLISGFDRLSDSDEITLSVSYPLNISFK